MMPVEGLERGGQVAVPCPGCSPDIERVHEVVKPAHQATVRCLACAHIHKVTLGLAPTVTVRVIVSIEEESERTEVEIPNDERLAVGEEFVVEVDEAPMGVRITSLELRGGERMEAAVAEDVGTIWSRAVDNVAVDVTIHPADGTSDATRSETYYLPGDEEMRVGDGIPLLDAPVRIEGLILREDAVSYDRRKLEARGATALAKDVKRAYARDRRADTWRSAWG